MASLLHPCVGYINCCMCTVGDTGQQHAAHQAAALASATSAELERLDWRLAIGNTNNDGLHLCSVTLWCGCDITYGAPLFIM